MTEKSSSKKRKTTNLEDYNIGGSLDFQLTSTPNTKLLWSIATPTIAPKTGKNVTLPVVIQLKGGQTMELFTDENMEMISETFWGSFLRVILDDSQNSKNWSLLGKPIHRPDSLSTYQTVTGSLERPIQDTMLMLKKKCMERRTSQGTYLSMLRDHSLSMNSFLEHEFK